jgi:hypothetical protein
LQKTVSLKKKHATKKKTRHRKNRKIFDVINKVLFCAFKTLTIDFVHFYDKITAKNVGTNTPLTCNFPGEKPVIFGKCPALHRNGK